MTDLSDTTEAEEAESSNALTFMVEPSGASTRTLQVMRSELGARLAAAVAETCGVLGLGLGVVVRPGEDVVEVGGLSMWSSVWRGFWHNIQ